MPNVLLFVSFLYRICQCVCSSTIRFVPCAFFINKQFRTCANAFPNKGQGSTLMVARLPGASEMRLRASENGTQLARWGKLKLFCDMFNSWRKQFRTCANAFPNKFTVRSYEYCRGKHWILYWIQENKIATYFLHSRLFTYDIMLFVDEESTRHKSNRGRTNTLTDSIWKRHKKEASASFV
jgi:hypothetical protein